MNNNSNNNSKNNSNNNTNKNNNSNNNKNNTNKNNSNNSNNRNNFNKGNNSGNNDFNKDRNGSNTDNSLSTFYDEDIENEYAKHYKLKTFHLKQKYEKLKDIITNVKSKYKPLRYNYKDFEDDIRTIYKIIKKEKFFELNEKQLMDATSQHNIYIEVLTYAILQEYKKSKRERKLPIFVYLCCLVLRPWLYNVIFCNLTRDEQIKFKKQLLDYYNETFSNSVFVGLTDIKKILELNEFENYDKKSSLQQFNYFIDCSFNTYTKPYSTFDNIFRFSDV